MRRLLFVFAAALTAVVTACTGQDRSTPTAVIPAAHLVRNSAQSSAFTPPPATFEITGVKSTVRAAVHKLHAQDATPLVCPTGIKHCGYPGDEIIANGEDTYNGGSPLYWLTQPPLPAGVTVTFDPDPTSGYAPNAVQINIQTPSTIAPGIYSFGIFETINADGSNPNIPVPLTFEICDPVADTCPAPSPSPSATPTSTVPTSPPTTEPTSPPTATPSPPLPPTPPPYPYTPDVSTDPAGINCSAAATFCIIQGSQESIYYVSEACGNLLPGICNSFQSTYSVSGVPSKMLFQFNPASIPGNDETTLTLRADKSLPPGSYPVSVTKTVADGRPPASETLTIQVLCSVRLNTCQQSVPADPQYTCFADLEPILVTATGIFVKRHPADSASSDVVYMNRTSDGSCPLPPPVLLKQSLTITQLSQPTITLSDSADASFGTLTWTISGNSDKFNSVAFGTTSTSAPPHANTLGFTVPAGTPAGTYTLKVTVTANSGMSASSTESLTVLPPVSYGTTVDPAGFYEIDNSGNLTDDDAGMLQQTADAGTVPDFGVPGLSTANAIRRSGIVHSQATSYGSYDPHNPTPGVMSDIAKFKANKNVGCLWVANFDNQFHDPTRGTQAARATYQIFGYCTPDISYTLGYTPVGSDFVTGASTVGTPHLAECPDTEDLVDGLFVCSATSPIPISPVSKRAENFHVVILYIGTLQALEKLAPTATFDRIPINDKGVIYPKVNVASLGYIGPTNVPGVVPFPNLPLTSQDPIEQIHYCQDFGSTADAGCVPRSRAGERLATALAQTYQPPFYNENPKLYVAHHLQPVCWGGNDKAVNGVFLLRDTIDPNKYHAQFTAWWNTSNFSADGSILGSDGGPDC